MRGTPSRLPEEIMMAENNKLIVQIQSLESRLAALNDVKWGLESRLKEAEEEVFIKCKQNGVLLERLSQAEAWKKSKSYDEFCSLEQRLSQAEATIHWVTAGEARKEILSLEARLSHLMDVAEKLSEWVEGYIDYLGHEDCGNECQQGEMRKEIEKLIAEWDGIKKEEK